MASFLKSIFSKAPAEAVGVSTYPNSKNDAEDVAQKASFQGELSVLPLDDVAQLFEYSRLTGELEISTSENIGYFYFQNGLLVFGTLGSSNQKIGELLLSERLISKEQLAECLEIQKYQEQQQRLGKILIQKGYLQQDKLSDSLVLQVKKAFFEVMTWKKGTFFFYVDHSPLEEDMVCSERVDSLLLEGMVHIDDSA